MDNAPNALVKDEEGNTKGVQVGDRLKIRYSANHEKSGWIEFAPENFSVELNGQPLKMCQEVSIVIKPADAPRATIKFALEEIDIDVDSLTALQALAEAKS